MHEAEKPTLGVKVWVSAVTIITQWETNSWSTNKAKATSRYPSYHPMSIEVLDCWYIWSISLS